MFIFSLLRRRYFFDDSHYFRFSRPLPCLSFDITSFDVFVAIVRLHTFSFDTFSSSAILFSV